jgi:hypothetical protein
VRGIAQRWGEDEVELARVALDDDDAAAAPHRGWTRRARGSVCLSVGDDDGTALLRADAVALEF